MTGFAGDLNAIQNLKARYCAAADLSAQDPERARAAFADILAEDVEGDYGVAAFQGRDALVEFLCTAIAGNSEWLLHMLHSPLIEIGAARATAEWTVMVHLKRRSGGRLDVVIGRYSDEFVRVDGRWWLSKVRFLRLE